uniref:Uncharacterized protein n=1 Tax=Gasterosteus aculeatus TaxID=69293 RepID=G3NCW0_GASAC
MQRQRLYHQEQRWKQRGRGDAETWRGPANSRDTCLHASRHTTIGQPEASSQLDGRGAAESRAGREPPACARYQKGSGEKTGQPRGGGTHTRGHSGSASDGGARTRSCCK